jgi:sulfur-carrier protein
VLQQLKTHSTDFQQAFSDNNLLCAVNQQLCDSTMPVKAGDEVAFFPPVTGG